MGKYLIGIDIGGTKCAIVLARESPLLFIGRKSFPTVIGKSVADIIYNIFEQAERILTENKILKDAVSSIGISCGGPLDPVKGIIKNPPNLPGWDEIPIIKMIEERFGVPSFLQNDADACVLAEWIFGAARGYEHVIYLTFGTGMGAGIILNGKLYSGACGMAGEIGHVRMENWGPVGYGKIGSFEGFCSGGGIGQIAKSKVVEKLQNGEKPVLCPEVTQLFKLTAKYVAEAAYKGDELAKEIYETAGFYLGKGVSLLIDILNPEVIVIGSIFERSKDLMWHTAQNVIARESLRASVESCKILPSELGDKVGDYAAIAVALNKITDHKEVITI